MFLFMIGSTSIAKAVSPVLRRGVGWDGNTKKEYHGMQGPKAAFHTRHVSLPSLNCQKIAGEVPAVLFPVYAPCFAIN